MTPPPEPASSLLGKYLLFSLAADSFGVPVEKVREIIRPSRIIPVPEAPRDVKGVITLRGKVVPVIALRDKFGLPEVPESERTCFLILHIQNRAGEKSPVGAVVDSVEEVALLQTPDFLDPSAAASLPLPLDREFVLGLAKVKDRVRILIDPDKVISAACVRAFPAAA